MRVVLSELVPLPGVDGLTCGVTLVRVSTRHASASDYSEIMQWVRTNCQRYKVLKVPVGRFLKLNDVDGIRFMMTWAEQG